MPHTICAGGGSPACRRGAAGFASRASGREAVLAFGSRSQSPFSLATKPERQAILTQASFSLR